MKRNTWLIFAGVQAMGVFLTVGGNFHSDPISPLLGGVLLLPGLLASVLVLHDRDGGWFDVAMYAIAIAVNAAVWISVAALYRRFWRNAARRP
jgi:hypothetical protein